MPTQQQIKTLTERRHPLYESMKSHWDFLEDTYYGGRQWFEDHIFKYIKEGDIEFADRVERAYRFNHTKEVVNLVSKYVLKGDIVRNDDAAPACVSTFWKNATRDGKTIKQYVREIDISSSIFGRIWVMTDSTATEGTKTVRDEKSAGAQVYSYIVKPQNLLDVAYDDSGRILWALILEEKRDDDDPFGSTGAVEDQYRLWTRDAWYLIGKSGSKRSKRFDVIDQREHELGAVPLFPVDVMGVSESPYHTPSLVNDVAYLDRSVANYLSNLDAIIQDQTFSQLAMPAQGVSSGSDEYNQLVEMGTKRIFLYNGQDGAKPFYLSPDPRQAELIVTVVKQIINEIYHSVGVAGERTKQDNAAGIDNSSGVAKAYDFERVKSLLAAKAQALQEAENKLTQFVRLWNGEITADELIDDPEYVTYPDDFDVRGLFDEFSIASQLSLIEAPESVRREHMSILVEKLFPRLSKDLKTEIEKELESWPPKPVSMFQRPDGAQVSDPFGDEQKAGRDTDQNKDAAE